MMLPSSLTDFLALAERLMTTDQRLWELVKGQEAGIWAQEWNVEVERFLKEKRVKEYFEGVWRLGGNVPTELRCILVSSLLLRQSQVSEANERRYSLDPSFLSPQPQLVAISSSVGLEWCSPSRIFRPQTSRIAHYA